MTSLFQLFKMAIARVGESSSSWKQFVYSGFLSWEGPTYSFGRKGRNPSRCYV